jgi:hypothetical protein
MYQDVPHHLLCNLTNNKRNKFSQESRASQQEFAVIQKQQAQTIKPELLNKHVR